MKYLLLIFLSFSAFAEIRLTFQKPGMEIVNIPPFKDVASAQKWIDENKNNKAWGSEYVVCGKSISQLDIAAHCQDITAEIQAKKDKEALDKSRIDELKLKDKAMTKDELIELLQLKGVL